MNFLKLIRRNECKYAFIYTVIMAIAMYTANRIFDYNYANSEIVRVLVYFEGLMTVYTILVYIKNYRGQATGKFRLTSSFVIYALSIGFVTFLYLKDKGYQENQNLFTFIIATNIFVGVSEELMYRGIVLVGLMKEYGDLKAVIISAVLFSLLHSVNTLGGFDTISVLLQLLTTFVYGIFAACMYLQIKSVLPLMLTHALWDTLIMSKNFIYHNPHIILLMLLVELSISAISLVRIYNKRIIKL